MSTHAVIVKGTGTSWIPGTFTTETHQVEFGSQTGLLVICASDKIQQLYTAAQALGARYCAADTVQNVVDMYLDGVRPDQVIVTKTAWDAFTTAVQSASTGTDPNLYTVSTELIASKQ